MQLILKGLDLNVIVNTGNEKLHLKPGECDCPPPPPIKNCSLKTCHIIS